MVDPDALEDVLASVERSGRHFDAERIREKYRSMHPGFIIYCPVCKTEYKIGVKDQWVCPKDNKHDKLHVRDARQSKCWG